MSCRRAFLLFSTQAAGKINALVQSFSTEVGWVGTVERLGNVYYVEDVYVFPQKANGAHFEAEDSYDEWSANLPDEVFSGIRFLGHSHVEMPAFFSGADIKMNLEIMSQLGDDDFYIFAVFNKYGEMDVVIFDKLDGVMYASDDIDIGGMPCQYNEFVEEAKSLVNGGVSY